MSEEFQFEKDPDLKAEAQKYASTTANDVSDHLGKYLVSACYMDGAMGEWAEKQKIQYAIEILESLISSSTWNSSHFKMIDNRIRALKEKLGDL